MPSSKPASQTSYSSSVNSGIAGAPGTNGSTPGVSPRVSGIIGAPGTNGSTTTSDQRGSSETWTSAPPQPSKDPRNSGIIGAPGTNGSTPPPNYTDPRNSGIIGAPGTNGNTTSNDHRGSSETWTFNPNLPTGGAAGGTPPAPSTGGSGGAVAAPPKSKAQLDAVFYETLSKAEAAAAAGNPKPLEEFYNFLGIAYDPAKLSQGYWQTNEQNAQRWVGNYFAGADTNRDGMLSEAEATSQSFSEYSADQRADGQLTKAEVLQLFNRRMDAGITEFAPSGDPRLTALAPILDNIMKANDANGDNKLTREELGEQVWLQYNEAARADNYVSGTEAAELLTDRANMGYIQSNTNFTKGKVGVAIEKLMGAPGHNNLYSVADVEAKLGGVKLPDWMVSDGKVSDTELATFVNNEVRANNLQFTPDGGIALTPNSLLAPPIAPVIVDPPKPMYQAPAPNKDSDGAGESQADGTVSSGPSNAPQRERPRIVNGQIIEDTPDTTPHPTTKLFETEEKRHAVGGVLEQPPVSKMSESGAASGEKYVRDTKDSGFAYPWSAAKSAGATDVPATIEKAVNFMNAAEGRSYKYDKVKGTITAPNGGFISRDDVQALNNIITKYHSSDFRLPDNASARAHEVAGLHASGSHGLEQKPVLADVGNAAVRIKDNSNGLRTMDSGVAGAAVKRADNGFHM